MITAVLVDDEKRAVEVLKDSLKADFPDIQILGSANSAQEAQTLITQMKPDLVFLDVAMPEESGFDLLNKLPTLDFEIIFVTAFDQYAMDAIKFCALGYVLKPIQREELVMAVQRAIKSIAQKQETNRNKLLLQNLINPGSQSNRIGIPTTDGLEFVSIQEIIRCEGVQRATKVVFEARKNLVSAYNLGEFKRMLEEYGFYSVHKSHLVNLDHVIRYDKEGFVHMTDKSNVPVARRKRQEFMQFLTRL